MSAHHDPGLSPPVTTPPLTVLDFRRMKKAGEKISMVTCYDAWSAKLLNASQVDCLLVGDSLAMVMHGFPTTLSATPEMMATHTAAVSRGAPGKFIVADMPFGSFRKSVGPAMECVEQLMRAGAAAVKLEGIWGHEEIVRQITGSGVPVMGHLGLTPQSIHQLGGFKVQGREQAAADDLVAQALKLEELGAFAIVLECIPSSVAERITLEVSVPTIGIGAGAAVDGQVLVLQDMLGLNPGFKPKFLRHYFEGHSAMRDALDRFDDEVKDGSFPSDKEAYL